MKEVNFKVQESDLDTVLTILQNLKSGLIHELKVQGSTPTKATHYQPVTSRVIKEEESGTHDRSGKYLNPNSYKKKLQQKK